MVKLYEYEAKAILSGLGVPVPQGLVVSTPDEARRAAERLGCPVMVKAQVLVAGRGRAGGIVRASTPDEAYEAAKRLLASRIKGLPVKLLLIEEAVEVAQELFISITIDRERKAPVVLASRAGGMWIEEVAKARPELVLRRYVDPLIGLQDYEVRSVVKFLGVQGGVRGELAKVVKALYKAFTEYDCELVELNPLALTTGGAVYALDARMIIDDNALYRHPEVVENNMGDSSEVTASKSMGFSYVKLDGDIGIIGNGAGLTMATMDVVSFYGGRPANFLDVGGGARAEVVERALTLLLRDDRVKVVLVNILGGITRCDEVAKGVVSALAKAPKKPVVVRLTGTNEEEGRRILEAHGIKSYNSMEEAARYAITLARRLA